MTLDAGTWTGPVVFLESGEPPAPPRPPCSHCGGCGSEPLPGRLLLLLVLNIKTVSEANQRAPWAVTKRKATQRATVKAALLAYNGGFRYATEAPGALPVVVTMTRITPRAAGLDDDNLGSSFKAIRDEVAAWLGIDDRDPRVSWRCAQEKGEPKAWAVRLEIRERAARRPA